MKAILSYPYSGAIYWWFATQVADASSDLRSKRPRHSYYRTLYGNVDKHIDLALSCVVAFDEVVIPAADAPFPGHGYSASDKMTLPGLQISAEWHYVKRATEIASRVSRAALQDHRVHHILGRIPEHARGLHLMYAIAELEMVRESGLPVLCVPGRRALFQRLIELGVVVDVGEAATVGGAIHDATEDYFSTVGGLRFRGDTVESLTGLKNDSRVRLYAKSFQRALLGTAQQDDPSRFFDELSDAWAAAERWREAAGAFTALSRALSATSLIPGVGTVTGVAALGLDGASEGSRHAQERLRWYELGAEMTRVQSIQALRARLELDE